MPLPKVMHLIMLVTAKVMRLHKVMHLIMLVAAKGNRLSASAKAK